MFKWYYNCNAYQWTLQMSVIGVMRLPILLLTINPITIKTSIKEIFLPAFLAFFWCVLLIYLKISKKNIFHHHIHNVKCSILTLLHNTIMCYLHLTCHVTSHIYRSLQKEISRKPEGNDHILYSNIFKLVLLSFSANCEYSCCMI